MVIKKKETYYLYFFIDLEGQGPLPMYPWGIKNLVVRGRNWRLIGFVFFISFEKRF